MAKKMAGATKSAGAKVPPANTQQKPPAVPKHSNVKGK